MSKKKKISIIVCAFLTALAITLGYYFKFSITDKQANTDLIKNGDIPNMSQAELKAQLTENQNKALFTVQVNSAGTIEVKSQSLNLTVANPSNNTADCYFEILNDDEVLYKSPTMKPKTYIENEQISKILEKGNHKLIVRYTVLYKEKPIGKADVEVNVMCK